MSKGFRKTRAQKIRATVRRQLVSGTAIKNETSTTGIDEKMIIEGPQAASRKEQSLYVYPVNLIKGDIVRSLAISGVLLVFLILITWTQS
jgi:hypothetical protein